MDSDKGSKGSEEVPLIDKPSTEPVALEKLVQHLFLDLAWKSLSRKQ